jgi:hypothetical protein
MKKTKSTSFKKRLTERVADVKNEMGDEVCLDNIPPDKRGMVLQVAFTLISEDDAIQRAFEANGLNPQDPFCWHILLSACCELLYPKRKGGRPKEWTPERLRTLLSDARKMEKQFPEGVRAPDLAVSKLLRRKFPEKYGTLSVEMLRAQLRVARSNERMYVPIKIFELEFYVPSNWLSEYKKAAPGWKRHKILKALIEELSKN